MLFSYTEALQQELPQRAHRFVRAAHALGQSGLVLGPEALERYLDRSGTGKEVASLIEAVTDEPSQKRVDAEIKRRVVTGRIPDEVGTVLTEVVEVLGLHRQDMSVSEVPLVATLYTDAALRQDAVIINITGIKALADAVRQLWSRVFTSPYPSGPVKACIVFYRMPPVTVSARVTIGQSITVRAGLGWGRLVGEEEVGDSYLVDGNTLRILDRNIGKQDSMVYRNPRTGEIARTAPRDRGSQKLTDDFVRRIAGDAKKCGEDAAVFGASAEKQYLLSFPSDSQPLDRPAPEPEPEEQAVPEPAIEIVDLDEQAAPEPEEVPEAEELVRESVEEDVRSESVETMDFEEPETEPAEPEPEEPSVENPADEEEEPDIEEEPDQEEEAEEPPADEEDEPEEGLDEETDEEIPQDEEDAEAYDEEDLDDEDAEEYEEGDEEAPQDEESEEGDEEEYNDEDEEADEPEDEEADEDDEDEEADGDDEDEEADGDEDMSASESLEETRNLATDMLNQALDAIERTMREWLRDDDQPEDFDALVQLVAQKRSVPYKQRILSLWEMRDSFDDPAPDQVALALETAQRFVKEF